MKKKIIALVAMIVAAAVCIGLVIAANPIPSYKIDPMGTPTVMKVGNTEIPANEYAAYFLSGKMSIQQQMAMYGMDPNTVWSDPTMGQQMIDSLHANTQSMITQYHVLLQSCDELGIKLTRDDAKEIQTYKKSMVDQYGGVEVFQAALTEQGLSEQMFDNSLVVSSCAKALNNYYFGVNGTLTPSDSELLTAFQNNYLQAKHILITNTDETGAPLTGDALAAKQARAEEALAKVQAGGNFDELITQYGEDPGMASNPDGYIFKEGDMVQEFYDGTKALEDGAISGLVESSYGYHIILRVPLDETKLDTYRDALVYTATGKDFSTTLQELTQAAVVTNVDEELARINIDNAFDIAMTGITPTAAATAPAAPAAPNTTIPTDAAAPADTTVPA